MIDARARARPAFSRRSQRTAHDCELRDGARMR